MLRTINMIKDLRNCTLVSASPSRRICQFSATVSALAGGASGTLWTQGVMSHGSATGFNLIPVVGTFPLLLFQGVYPVSLSCSLRIALWSCALNVGSPMGLVWAGGVPPLPLLPLPPLPHCWCPGSVVASNCHPRWWASSSDTLIYPFIFAFPSLSLHHRSTTTHLRSDTTTHDRARAHMTIALTLSDRSHLFDGHMTYNSHVFTSILSVSNVPPLVVRPITSSRTMRSGTFYSFTICLHSCLPFVFNLPVVTFRQRRSLPKP